MFNTFWVRFAGPMSKIRVVLNRNTDQTGDRALRLLLQFFRVCIEANLGAHRDS